VTEPLLDVEDLRTYFSTEEGVVRAVDGITFDLKPGERRGVVGESGSGKSVTAMSIMRLIEPPAGEIVTGTIDYRGSNLLTLDEDEMQAVRGGKIAVMFQDPMTALNPVYTIGDQLTETIVMHQNVSKKDARDIAIKALEDVQIPNAPARLDDYPHQFSGGMRQRVMIAMGLSCNPDLLIADEPTTALDVTTQAQIMDLMFKLSEDRGTAVLLITHDLGVVAGFCDTVQVMYAGGIVEYGTADDIYHNPQHPYTWGLLASMTRLDEDQRARLHSIPGAPPSVIDLPAGCRFRPRCEFAIEICGRVLPAIHPIGDGVQQVACHRAEELDLNNIVVGGDEASDDSVDDTTQEQVVDSEVQEAVEAAAGVTDDSAQVTS
jgi:oligopeptide transport system ATP-binding protein